MPVTTISSRFCQRVRCISRESLRVTSIDPTTSTHIKPHVYRIVALSLNKPYCQKMISSGLRCMICLLCQWTGLFGLAGESCHDQPCDEKPEQTGQHALP